MKQDVKLPKLGEGADSGVVVGILVQAGDVVKKDQIILELENEKAVAPIPAPVAGTVSEIRVKEGDTLSVGQMILVIETDQATEGQSSGGVLATAASQAPPPQTASLKAISARSTAGTPSGLPPAAAPSIRRIARDLGIDLSHVPGSQRGGRIIMADLRAYIHRLQELAAQPAVSDGNGRPAVEAVDFSQWGPVEKKPMSPLRQVISRRMTENWRTIPHVTQFDEADLTELMDLRKQYLPAYEQRKARLTLTSFALKVLANCLGRNPMFNASYDEAAQEIVFKNYCHLGVAVDTDAGLIVPVIRDAHKKSVMDLTLDLQDLAARARDRKVKSEELKGGTFTLSNQGGIAGAHFTPIINKPEVAILGLGRGSLRPVWREKKVEPRLIMPVSLSYDHRLIDGGLAARFLNDIVQGFESFAEEDLKLKS